MADKGSSPIIDVLHPGRPNVSKLCVSRFHDHRCLKIQNGLDIKVEKSRKQLKERKNRATKIRGVKKTKASDAIKAGKK